MRFVVLSLALALAVQTLANPVPLSSEAERTDAASREPVRLRALNAPSQGLEPEHGPAGRRGALASEVDVCSNVGADLLERGGSAADAVSDNDKCVRLDADACMLIRLLHLEPPLRIDYRRLAVRWCYRSFP